VAVLLTSAREAAVACPAPHDSTAAPPPPNPPTPREQVMKTDGKDVVPEVWEVLDKIKGFSDKVGVEGGLGVKKVGVRKREQMAAAAAAAQPAAQAAAAAYKQQHNQQSTQ